MKWSIIILVFLAMTCCASEQQDAFNTVQKISGISVRDLKGLLADCENTENQQSMYFCTWRDYEIERKKLHDLVVQKQKQFPKCALVLQNKVNNWEKPLYIKCKKKSIEDFGGGSFQSTAQMVCMRYSAADYQKIIEKLQSCQDINTKKF